MNHILFQMNGATAPMRKTQEPTRQIGNYFSLLGNMTSLALCLIWERRGTLKCFDGILNNESACTLYDEIVRCVMRPHDEVSEYFQPEEIDAIAETLAKPGMTPQRCTEYLKTIIHSRIERLMLDAEGDGDTHAPTINWAAHAGEEISPAYSS